jgi:hypothetical protein
MFQVQKCVLSTVQVLRSAHVLCRPTFTVNVCANSMRGPAFPLPMAQFNSPVLSGSLSSSAVCQLTCASSTGMDMQEKQVDLSCAIATSACFKCLYGLPFYRRFNFTLLFQLNNAVFMVN